MTRALLTSDRLAACALWVGISWLLAIWLLAGPASAAQCAAPGRDGTVAGLAGVVNTYWSGTASVSVGATAISVGAAGGAAAPIAAGDLLLVMQMQDATIGAANGSTYGDGATGAGVTSLGNSGVYEFARATTALSTAGGTVGVTGAGGGGLLNGYTYAAAGASSGQHRFQVIRVPSYNNATFGGTLTAARWDGSRGGVLAIDVAGTLDLNGGTMTASGLGFRGGAGVAQRGTTGLANTDYRSIASLAANGSKGEGVAGTPRYVNDAGSLLDTGVEGYPNGASGRGAPGNAGGGGTDGNPSANDQNTGGGGGANRGSGGAGGYAWCQNQPVGCPQTGGLGGAALGLSAGRLTMGGGGGAGTTNDGTGTPSSGFASSGAAGGGIVILRAASLKGSGSITADGSTANQTLANDASGGGGAGGAVLFYVGQVQAGASGSVSAQGGQGGSNTGNGAAHGPGGGGGGGYVVGNLPLAALMSGGATGTTQNGGSYGASYGAGTGATGASDSSAGAASVTGVSSGGECTPTLAKSFSVTRAAIGQPARLNLAFVNPHTSLGLTSVALIDAYPATLVNAPTPNATSSCGGMVTATAGTSSLALSGATLAAGATCTVSVNVAGGAAGAQTNTVPAGGLTATQGGAAVKTLAPASATLTVTAPLTATKTVQTVSDPLDLTINPKAIPGARLDYVITVSNPTGTATDPGTVSITDALPAGVKLVTGDLGAAGSGPIAFTDGSPATGLGYTFTSLASTTDDVDFSSDGGASFTYTPVVNAAGIDPAVTHIRVHPKGAQASATSFQIRFRVAVQ